MSRDLPDVAFAAALAAVPMLGPARLGRLLARWSPPEAWSALWRGRATAVWSAGEPDYQRQRAEPAIAAAMRRLDPAAIWDRVMAAGVGVHLFGEATYPALLLDDPMPPPVLFSLGNLQTLEGRRVTVVGTRNASGAGREVAAELGAGLASHGVSVVSGLARGIDGWAHRGALGVNGGAPPIGVVACGLDVVYPAEHRQLWEQVGHQGLLLSEVPPGVSPVAYRFPLRNRVLAALGELVVVVESRHKGGSLHTVDEAEARGIDVLVVPGSARNPAAEGTNQLLVSGAAPVLCSADVICRLGFERPVTERKSARARIAATDRWALELLGGDQLDLDALVHLSGHDLATVASTLARLELDGWVTSTSGWFERASRSAGRRP